MAQDDKKLPTTEDDPSRPIGQIVHETEKEDVPLRLRRLAQQLEASLAKQAENRKKSSN